MVGKRYKNPPVIEALCEFQFESTASWDLAIPGIIYDQVKQNFPKRLQTNRITVDISSVGEKSPRVSSSPITQFWSEDDKFLVQIGENLLSVNHLKSYTSWNIFLPMISNIFNIYRNIAAPGQLHGATLRYINRFEFTDRDRDLNDYFELRPHIGSDLPKELTAFAVIVQIPFENAKDMLNVHIGTAIGVPPNNQRIINLDKVWLGSLAVSHTLSSPEIRSLYPNKGAATAIVSSLDLEIIASLYALRDNVHYLSAFLTKNPHLVGILIDAYGNIRRYFPYSNIFLQVSVEPEEYGVEQATLI